MDYLFVNTGDCNDSLRDREFYLVQQCGGIGEAIARLSAYFLSDEDTATEVIDHWEVFLTGENLQINNRLIGQWVIGNYTIVY